MEQTSNSLDNTKDAAPEPERRPILLRAYCEVATKEPRTKAPKTPEWLLVFDTETMTDESQRLRFGTYQLWEKGRLQENGLFYDKVSRAELDMLTAEAPKHRCAEPLSVSDFVHKIFMPVAFKARGSGCRVQSTVRSIAPSHRSCGGADFASSTDERRNLGWRTFEAGWIGSWSEGSPSSSHPSTISRGCE